MCVPKSIISAYENDRVDIKSRGSGNMEESIIQFVKKDKELQKHILKMHLKSDGMFATYYILGFALFFELFFTAVYPKILIPIIIAEILIEIF